MDKHNNKILVIDDNPENIRILTGVLETEGYMVLQAVGGKMGLKIASNARPDLIFLDIRMPEMNGYETCRQLKADPVLSDIPVIFLSGLSEPSEKVEAFQAGGVDYIVKPLQSQEVLARVRTHLELHRMKCTLEICVKERTAELEKTNQTLKEEIQQRLIAEKKLKLDEERLESLLKLNEMNHLIEKEIIDNVLEDAVRITRSRAGFFRYVTGGEMNGDISHWPNNPSGNGRNDSGIENHPACMKSFEDCLRTGEPLINNAVKDNVDPIDIRHDMNFTTRHMVVPIYDEKSIIAVIGVVNKHEDYNEADERQLTLLSQGLWRLVQRKRSEEERKKLETQLRQAQKMEAIGTLAGGIAHDFNNILSPILCYAEMEMSTTDRNSRTHKRMSGIYQAGLRARDLVRQILTFSREKETEVRPIEIQPIIKEALKLIKSSIPSTIILKQNIHENCGAVMGDPTQIHQIIMNLCTNAYHAMKDRGGELTVSLSETVISPLDHQQFKSANSGPYILFSVCDTGHGMSKDILERVFDPYFTTKNTSEGTGLGLSIVHGIVKNMGGFIHVYSEPGKGSSFKIYFPKLESKEELVQYDDIDMPNGSEHILVIDDDQAVADVVGQMLDTIGYAVTIETDPIRACDIFEESPAKFDLIITDLTMPGMNGLDLSKKMIACRNDIPIIMFTGFSDAFNNEMIKSCGVQSVIMKPVASWELAKTIRQVFEKKTDRKKVA